MEPSTEDFNFALQREREDIGDYNGSYIDSQKKDLFASPSSHEELEEDNFIEEEYANDVRNLEDIWWFTECMHNVHIFSRSNKRMEREGKRKREDRDFSTWEAPGLSSKTSPFL